MLTLDYIKYITSSKFISKDYTSINAQGQEEEKHFNGTVPMYTGIGLRIRAEFKALKSGLNISGLPAIAVASSFNGISGRLTVQTLGITGAEGFGSNMSVELLFEWHCNTTTSQHFGLLRVGDAIFFVFVFIFFLAVQSACLPVCAQKHLKDQKFYPN